MTDDIIKRKLKEVELKYKLTPRYFQIKREINMTSKEPAWFKSFRIKQETFNKNQESFNKNQESFNKNQESFNKNQESFNKNQESFNKNQESFNK